MLVLLSLLFSVSFLFILCKAGAKEGKGLSTSGVPHPTPPTRRPETPPPPSLPLPPSTGSEISDEKRRNSSTLEEGRPQCSPKAAHRSDRIPVKWAPGPLTFVAVCAPAPGDIITQPGSKIVFNAPYDDKHTYHIKVTNSSARRIGWAFNTNMKRLEVDPAVGVLDPMEAALIAVSCNAFAYGQENTNYDHITIKWFDTPNGATKQFSREWFQMCGPVRRKNILIEYNP